MFLLKLLLSLFILMRPIYCIILNSSLLNSLGYNKSSQFIGIYGQNITDIDPKTFEGYVNLFQLELTSNQLINIDISVFKGAVNLSYLTLNDNPLKELSNKKNITLTSLLQLVIYGTHLSDFDSNLINGLPNLRYLDVQNGFERNSFNPLRPNELSTLGDLRSLTLSNRNQENLTKELFNGLDSLDTLYFIYSNIKHIDSNTFSGLSNLTYIDLQNNSLTSLVDFELPENLIFLGLEMNQLNSIRFAKNGGIGGLEKLDLSYNQFKSFKSIDFGLMTNLTSLVLSSNPIDDPNELIGDLRPLRNLYNLYLVGLGINSINSSFFQYNSELRTIELGFNNMSRFPTESFKNLSELLMISFQANQLRELDNQTFAGLSQIVTINLSMNQISRIDAAAFKELKNLEFIYLRRNLLTEIDASTFRGMEKISEIDLAYNKLTSIAPGTFTNLTNLRYVFLDRNDITYLDSSTFHGCNNLVAIYLFNNTDLDTANMGSLCPTNRCHVYY